MRIKFNFILFLYINSKKKKFLENALQNKDSLLEKLKKESEEHYKNLKKFESDNSKQDETINQLMISLNEKEQMFIQEKNNFFEETKNLKKMFKFYFNSNSLIVLSLFKKLG